MDTLEKLIAFFSRFPGIGPRQARRFTQFLLREPQASLNEFTALMQDLKKSIVSCNSCKRYFTKHKSELMCSWCSDTHRSDAELMIVEKDVDAETIERSGGYEGRYFVLGGRLLLLEKKPEERIRSHELLTLVKMKVEKKLLREIIFALSATPEGEETTHYLVSLLKPITEKNNIMLTSLGRGLSTGAEVEYADAQTIKSALAGRK